MFDSNGPSAKFIELHQIRLFIRFHANVQIRESVATFTHEKIPYTNMENH